MNTKFRFPDGSASTGRYVIWDGRGRQWVGAADGMNTEARLFESLIEAEQHAEGVIHSRGKALSRKWSMYVFRLQSVM